MMLLVGCSGTASNEPSIPSVTSHTDPTPTTTSTSASIVPSGGLVVPECADTGMCAAGFVLDDGVFYNIDCSAIRESAVSDEVIGEGDIDVYEVSVNLLVDVPRSVLVAVSQGGGFCGFDEFSSEWVAAFPDGVDNPALLEAICDVGELSAAQREANGC